MLLRQDSLFQVEFHFDLRESIFKTYSQRHKINVHEKIIIIIESGNNFLYLRDRFFLSGAAYFITHDTCHHFSITNFQ